MGGHIIGDLIIVNVRVKGRGKGYNKEAPGFSHLAFNAYRRKQIDQFYKLLRKLNVNILDAPEDMNYSPGYYAVWFEDPDGMKLELAYTPFQNSDIRNGLERLIKKRKRK